jgi:glycine cleavage system H protein
VSGDVVEKNVTVEDTPSLINTSCYENGWLFKLKLTKTSELDALLSEKQYEEFLKSDAH